MFKKRKQQIINKFDNSSLILGPSSANSFRQESLDIGQVRGNGLLILTEEELYFGMYLPRKDFHIPLNLIYEAKTTKGHLGKTKSRKLLKVEFTNIERQSDSLAWLVNDLDTWINSLRNVIKKS